MEVAGRRCYAGSLSRRLSRLRCPGRAAALLHGHSFTAHPIGCHLASLAVRALSDPAVNPNIVPGSGPVVLRDMCGLACLTPAPARAPLSPPRSCPLGIAITECFIAVARWDPARIAGLASLPCVARVVALGSVFAAELRPRGGASAGYHAAASPSADVLRRMRARGVWGRPLGNTVYLMTSPLAEAAAADALLDSLAAELSSGGESVGRDSSSNSVHGALPVSKEVRYQPVP